MVILSRLQGAGIPSATPSAAAAPSAIEAALIAKNRAPGLNRTFAAQKWDFVPSGGFWMDRRWRRPWTRSSTARYDIWGGDIDPRAVDIARANARQGRRWRTWCASTWRIRHGLPRREATYGRLVTNPPYGERLLERQEAGALYRHFGQVVRRGCRPTWRALSISQQPHGI